MGGIRGDCSDLRAAQNPTRYDGKLIRTHGTTVAPMLTAKHTPLWRAVAAPLGPLRSGGRVGGGEAREMNFRRVVMGGWFLASILWIAFVAFRLTGNCQRVTFISHQEKIWCPMSPGGDLGSYLPDALGQTVLLGLGIPLAIAALMGAVGISIRVVRRFRNSN